MLEESIKHNIIIAMDTGSGKTHIAVLRIKHEVEREPSKVRPSRTRRGRSISSLRSFILGRMVLRTHSGLVRSTEGCSQNLSAGVRWSRLWCFGAGPMEIGRPMGTRFEHTPRYRLDSSSFS